MENKFNNLIKAMKNEKMTGEEKTSIRFRVETFVNNNPVKSSISTPYLKVSPYFSKFSFATLGKTVGVAILLVIIGTGGLTYVSASALPGDFLYPVKRVAENIQVQFASTPAKKVAFKSKIIETRFKEAEELIKTNKITDEKQAIIESSIAENKKDIKDNLEIMSKENPEVATIAQTNLDTLIETHQDAIDTLTDEKGDEIEFIENELTSSETSFENEINSDLEIMEKVDGLDNIDNLDPEIESKLFIQNTEIVSNIAVIPVIASDLSASIISATPEKIDSTSSNPQEENQTNP